MAPRSQEPQDEKWVPFNEGLAKLFKQKEEKTNELINKIAESIETQNFFTQLEEAPKFEDLPKETQKEIIGNPDDWDKINLEKPKRERKKKVKQQPIKVEKAPLIKYFVEFKVNVKGTRKEVGYIIATDNEKNINKMTTLRALDEFVNFRTLNCLTYRELQEGDIEYVRDIVDAPRTSPEPILEETNIDTREDMINKIINNVPDKLKLMKFWKIVITPGRRPRPRDYDKFYVLEAADTSEEAKSIVKSKFMKDGYEVKDKNMILFPIQLEDVIKSNKFRSFLNQLDDDDLKVFDIVDMLEHRNDEDDRELVSKTPIAKPDMDKFETFSAEIDKEGFITKVYPNASNILEQNTLQNYTKFYITPINTSIKYKTVEVLAKNEYAATTNFIQAVFGYSKDERRNPAYYKDIDRISVVNSITGAISDLSVRAQEV